MSNLLTAIKMAADAHDHQVDKAGEPYILHPLRVMLAQTDEPSRIAAVLHDVVEDSMTVGHGDILAFFGEEVHAAVFALTRQPGEDYFAYIKRAAANDIARRVKLADLRDNMDPQRVLSGSDAKKRLAKYQKAYVMLLEPAP